MKKNRHRHSYSRIDTLRKIEIPEGVAISLRVAGPVARASAEIIDWLVIFGLIMVMLILIGILSTVLGNLAQGLFFIGLFTVYWFYGIYFESGKRGATPGKRSMKLRVVMQDGTPAPLSAIFIRNMLKPVDMLPLGYGLGLISCLITNKFQRLGDLAAGTVVIHVPDSEQRKTNKRRTKKKAAKEQPSRAPMVLLSHEEQSAIVAFKERHLQWGPQRSQELAEIVDMILVGKQQESERLNQEVKQSYHRLLEIGEWIQRGEDKPMPTNQPQPQKGEVQDMGAAALNDLNQSKQAMEIDLGPELLSQGPQVAQRRPGSMHKGHGGRGT